jgi:hypothetical protein
VTLSPDSGSDSGLDEVTGGRDITGSGDCEADGDSLGAAVGVSEIVIVVVVSELCTTGSSIVGSDESSSANVGAIVERIAPKRASAAKREKNFTDRFSERQ